MDETIAKALRAPFAPELVGKRPQPTCRACSQSPTKNCDKHKKAKCAECDQWMTTAHTHLDFVGHADITDRFLSADPDWTWEPVQRAVDPQILAAAVATGNPDVVKVVMESAPPKFDSNGGMWIRLTIGGVTRLGYGDAAGKTGANAIKEAIGDGLRNAGMRFGAGLDMWRKESPAEPESAPQHRAAPAAAKTDQTWLTGMEGRIKTVDSEQELQTLANEIEAKREAGFCEQAHYEQLWTLGERRHQDLTAERGHVDEQPRTPAPDPAAAPTPAPAPVRAVNGTPPAGDAAAQFEHRLTAATTVEELDQIKAEVMADFKAQKFDPTAGNKLLRDIKGRRFTFEENAA